jgi:hypothetical protein
VGGSDQLQVALRSDHGKYLSAQPGGNLEWNRDAPGDWEMFELTGNPLTATFHIKTAHGKFIAGLPDGGAEGNRDATGEWETFTCAGTRHAISPPCARSTCSCFRISTYNPGLTPLSLSLSLSFLPHAVAMPGDNSIKTAHGKFVSVQPDGSVQPRDSVGGAYETITFEDKGDNKVDMFPLQVSLARFVRQFDRIKNVPAHTTLWSARCR